MALNKYIIERDIPEVGSLEREQLAGAAVDAPPQLVVLCTCVAVGEVLRDFC